jgi:cell wall-associated NlpC family hydrolase
MPIKRLTFTTALVSALVFSASLQAKTPEAAVNLVIARSAPDLLGPLAIFNPVPRLAQSAVPTYEGALLADQVKSSPRSSQPTSTLLAQQAPAANAEAVSDNGAESITDLRKALLAVAMKLRDIPYVRGGHDPSTGFDCSGFVRYVFAHAIGLHLPTNSAAQFLAGLKVKRSDMKPGDLVFFHTRGRHRISHVGIYISNGQFIHSPATGKSVEISSLDTAYWAKRFAGAKRPEAIALAARNG